jgi:CDP-diacylglycerol--glycerol-3-phosphate 3-phosphatidyltransferase
MANPLSNIANMLTVGRLFLLPPMIVLFYVPTLWAAWACLALYTVGAVTDWLDGWIARRYNAQSEFGRFLDPIADKIFVVTVLLMLVAVDRVTGIWVIAVIIILMREFLVAGVREFLGPKGISVPVTGLAKWKTTVQMVCTGFLIMAPLGWWWVDMCGMLGLAAAAALTVMTGWGYLKAGLQHI